MDKNAIIFDLGGVLINLNFKATDEAFEKLGMKDVQKFYRERKQDLFNKLETGEIPTSYFIEEVSKELQNGTTAEEVTEAWNAMLLDVPIGRPEILKSLRPKYKIFLLSNTNAIHVERVLENWLKGSSISPEEVFDKVYYSNEIGMRKPNACIFEHVISEHDLDIKKTLFIDDTLEHINAARELGIESLHLTDVSVESALIDNNFITN